MECEKTINLLENKPNQPSRTKNLVEMLEWNI